MLEKYRAIVRQMRLQHGYFMQQLAPHASSVSVVGHDCPSAILVIIHYSVGTCRGYSHTALVFLYFLPIFTLYILFSFHFYKGTMVIRRLSLHLWAYQHNSHMG